MPEVMNIIANMPQSVRSKAEEFATAKGITLEEAVSQQLSYEISDADLDAVSGGSVDVEVDAEADVRILFVEVDIEVDVEVNIG